MFTCQHFVRSSGISHRVSLAASPTLAARWAPDKRRCGVEVTDFALGHEKRVLTRGVSETDCHEPLLVTLHYPLFTRLEFTRVSHRPGRAQASGSRSPAKEDNVLNE
ncbi:hypothetical protein GN956_G7581 [Arapaima gigas]